MVWFNTDRATVIVAALALFASIAAVIAAIVYGNRQAGIAAAAKEEARRSADAAEAQAAIASEAKEEARRSADAAHKALKLEARRDHLAGAVKDVELLRVETRPHRRMPHRELWAVISNNGQRDYRYDIQVEYKPGHHSSAGTGTIQAGETIHLYLIHEEIRYRGILAWLGGDCPCDEPDDKQGHWRKFWAAPTPVVPEDEPPNIW